MGQRRKCRLVNHDYAEIDLRDYSKLIIDTINETIPGKNPRVTKTYFSTDPLTQGEAIMLGRALSRLSELARFGKTVTNFRLFDGHTYADEEATEPMGASQKKGKSKGGRRQ